MPEYLESETVDQSQEIENIEIRSEEVQEILSHVPNALIRWGISAILVTTLAIIIASWFIKYPDTIAAQITLTTQTPPASIIARSSGAIIFTIEDDSQVQKNAPLGVIDNPANYQDIAKLKKYLKDFTPYLGRGNTLPATFGYEENLVLGELQNSYISFLNSINDYRRFIDLDFHNQQIKNLNERIAQYQVLNENLKLQQNTILEELSLAADNYKTDSILQQQDSGTKLEANRSRSTYLQTKRQSQSVKSNITNNSLQKVTLEGQIKELKSDKNENEDKLRNDIENAYKQLESQFNQWEQKFLLRSPISGKVSFSKYWSNNQFINTGDIVMTIIPDTQEIFGQLIMPQAGSGKVETGQKVNITFDNYPRDEYGIVTGKVEKISLVPQEQTYTVRVSFPNNLMSSYKRDLPFKPQMQGTAEIITKDLRLMERVFNQFRALLKNSG